MTSTPEVEWLELIRTWPTWHKRYKQAGFYHERLGLLRCGFTMTPVQDVDLARRIIFYLELADGFDRRESRKYDLPGDNVDPDVVQTMYALESLQRVAFDELIQNFFLVESPKDPSYFINWHEVLESNELLTAVLRFFRPDTESAEYFERLLNLPEYNDRFSKEQLAQVRRYLNTFIDALLGLRSDLSVRGPRPIDQGTRASEVVRILACQGKRINVLTDRQVTITPPMHRQLELIAYRGKAPTPDWPLKRLFANSSGAVRGAAQVLLLT